MQRAADTDVHTQGNRYQVVPGIRQRLLLLCIGDRDGPAVLYVRIIIELQHNACTTRTILPLHEGPRALRTQDSRSTHLSSPSLELWAPREFSGSGSGSFLGLARRGR